MAVLDPQRLGHADACLVEVDHLSDHAGGARLADDRALDAMADALAGAVRAHLRTSRYGRAVPKVTPGEYSQALDDYLTIILSDPAEETIRVNLLRRSATFLAVMKNLDKQTIAAGSAADNTISYTDIDQGRVTAGPHKGKFRVEMTHFVDLGHRFIPGTSPEAPWNANFVTVEESGGPNGPDRGTFVEAFVHETMHLDAAVFSRFPAAGTTLAQKIDAFFDEEISVRTKTLAIMKEITKGNPGDLSGYVTPTPPMVRRDVERDFQSGSDRLTYLEGVVFDNLIADAIVAESIDAQTLTQLTKQANEESVGPSDRDLLGNIGGFVLVWDPQQKIYVNPATKTLELLIRRRAVQARWKMLFDAGLSAVDQEAAAQKHASLFFPAGIQYSP
jgi:hypothetical protein